MAGCSAELGAQIYAIKWWRHASVEQSASTRSSRGKASISSLQMTDNVVLRKYTRILRLVAIEIVFIVYCCSSWKKNGYTGGCISCRPRTPDVTTGLFVAIRASDSLRKPRQLLLKHFITWRSQALCPVFAATCEDASDFRTAGALISSLHTFTGQSRSQQHNHNACNNTTTLRNNRHTPRQLIESRTCLPTTMRIPLLRLCPTAAVPAC